MVIPIEVVSVQTDHDLSRVRRAVSSCASSLHFDAMSRTRLVTAASELSRNMLKYGGGGFVQIDKLRDTSMVGVRATFADQGPGMADMDEALADGFSSGLGLGLGLGGARRLVDEFHLDSKPGEGTTVSIATWVRNR